jgi:hypothetical protein
MMSNPAGIRRPYITETVVVPGCAVVRGGADNKVKAPDAGGGDFIGIYPFEANEVKGPGEPIGIALTGVVKALAGGNVTAGKKAVIKDDTGSLVLPPGAPGAYETAGVFLEDGAAGEYVDFLIERGSVTVKA